MTRIALANIRYPSSPDESVRLVNDAIVRAADRGAEIVCSPECYVPGYRGLGHAPPPPDPDFLDNAWSSIAATAAASSIAVVLGTERVVDDRVRATALVIDRNGTQLGF